MLDDESMGEFLVGLDRRDNVSLPLSGTVAHNALPVTSSPSVTPTPGPSQDEEARAQVTNDMFALPKMSRRKSRPAVIGHLAPTGRFP